MGNQPWKSEKESATTGNQRVMQKCHFCHLPFQGRFAENGENKEVCLFIKKKSIFPLWQ